MSFWNNPENNSVKMLLLVVVLIGIGAWVYTKNNSGDAGRVINVQSGMTNSGGAANSGKVACVPTMTPEPGGTCRIVYSDCSAVRVEGDCSVIPGKAVMNSTETSVKAGAVMTR